MTGSVRILGIDPGSQFTGFGLIDADRNRSIYIACGVIRTGGGEIAARLRCIFGGIRELVVRYSPGEIAIERVFVHRNIDSALKLGHARAAALCATFETELPIYEYAPRAIKQAVVGLGGASKEQVQHMTRVLLALARPLETDAADALAVALCHAHQRQCRTVLALAAARTRP